MSNIIFVDAFDELTDKITYFMSNVCVCVCVCVCVSYSILYLLLCNFYSSISNDWQDFANLLLGYFNLGDPVHRRPTCNWDAYLCVY